MIAWLDDWSIARPELPTVEMSADPAETEPPLGRASCAADGVARPAKVATNRRAAALTNTPASRASGASADLS